MYWQQCKRAYFFKVYLETGVNMEACKDSWQILWCLLKQSPTMITSLMKCKRQLFRVNCKFSHSPTAKVQKQPRVIKACKNATHVTDKCKKATESYFLLTPVSQGYYRHFTRFPPLTRQTLFQWPNLQSNNFSLQPKHTCQTRRMSGNFFSTSKFASSNLSLPK